MLSEVIDILIGDTTVQGLVGRNKASSAYKVFPVVCPQGEDAPFIVGAITGCDELVCKDNSGAQPNEEYIDLLFYGKNYKDVDTLERAATDILNGVSTNVFSLIIMKTHKDLFDHDRKEYVRVSSYQFSKP